MSSGATTRAGVEPGPGLTLTARVGWALRVTAFVAVSFVALLGRADHLGVVVVALVAIGALLTGDAAIELAARHGRQVPAWLPMLVLAGMGGAAGIVTALPEGEIVISFALVAAIAAGSQLDIGPACAVVAVTILAIEVSSLLFGFNTGDVGWPLAVLAAVLAGRYRRDARIQSAQAAALLAQSEQVRAQEQRAATLDERARIAREIHDLLAHSLGALGIQIEAAQALLVDARDIDRAVSLLDRARWLAASGLEETRRAIDALRNDTAPLPQSLAALADAHIDQNQTPVVISVTGTPRALGPDANLALVRTAHEALTNAAKHAPAAPLSIVLDYGPEWTTMTVSNRPSPASQARTGLSAGRSGSGGGYGLAGMRERLLLMGGTFTAGPTDPGWAVRAQVPL